MTVTLYNYTGMDNVANKLLSRLCTRVWEGTITTYGAFTPRGGHFVLSNLYQCNYATFQYDGITYYANVDISTDSKGLYRYDCTTDSLATAYYKGCMNSVQYYKYISDWEGNAGLGTDFFERICTDSRVSSSNMILMDYHNIYVPTDTRTWTYVLGLFCPESDNKNGVESPNINVYAINQAGFHSLIDDKFFSNDEAVRATMRNFSRSVAFCYLVDESNLSGLTTTTTDRIYWYDPNLADTAFAGKASIILGAAGNHNVRKINIRNSVTKSVNVMIDLQQANINETQCLHVLDVGDIYFRFSDILNIDTIDFDTFAITKIGYDIAYDFSDGIVIAHLVINDEPYYQCTVSARIPYSIPMFTDEYIKDEKAGVFAMAQSSITTIANLANGNIGGAAMSAAQGFIAKEQTEYQQQRSDSLTPMGIVNNASNSTDRARKQKSYFRYTWRVTNQGAIETLYGFMWYGAFNPYTYTPDHNQLKGSFTTQGCRLPSNGLPKYIIQEAGSRCDMGYIIAPSNADYDPYHEWPW